MYFIITVDMHVTRQAEVAFYATIQAKPLCSQCCHRLCTVQTVSLEQSRWPRYASLHKD